MTTVAHMRSLLEEVKERRGVGKFDLPTSGQISASDINMELDRAHNAEFHLGGAEERGLAGVFSGEISFSDFHGKSFTDIILTVGRTEATVGPQIVTAYGVMNTQEHGWVGSITDKPVIDIVPAGSYITQLHAQYNETTGDYISYSVLSSTVSTISPVIELRFKETSTVFTLNRLQHGSGNYYYAMYYTGAEEFYNMLKAAYDDDRKLAFEAKAIN